MRRTVPLLCLTAAILAVFQVRPAVALFSAAAGIKEGDPAPMFSGATIDNQKIDFAQLKGKKVVLLDFWSIYCASCIEEMPRLNEIHNEFGNKGLVVIGVNLDSFGTHRVAKFMNGMETKIIFPVIIDKDRKIGTMFGAMVLPTTLVIDLTRANRPPRPTTPRRCCSLVSYTEQRERWGKPRSSSRGQRRSNRTGLMSRTT